MELLMRERPSQRRRLVAVIGGLALVLLAGCGEEGEPSSDELLKTAFTHAEGVKTYSLAVRLRTTLNGADDTLTGRGVSNADSSKFTLSTSYEEKGERAKFVIRLVGARAYIRYVEPRDVLPEGKVWLRSSDPAFTQRSLTPSQLVDVVGDDLEEVGREVVRGEPTVRLRGKLDLEKAAEATRGPLLTQLRKAPEAFRQLAPTLDVWLTEQDTRVVRTDLVITAKDVKGRVDNRTDYLAEDVKLEAPTPSASETIDEAELDDE